MPAGRTACYRPASRSKNYSRGAFNTIRPTQRTSNVQLPTSNVERFDVGRWMFDVGRSILDVRPSPRPSPQGGEGDYGMPPPAGGIPLASGVPPAVSSQGAACILSF